MPNFVEDLLKDVLLNVTATFSRGRGHVRTGTAVNGVRPYIAVWTEGPPGHVRTYYDKAEDTLTALEIAARFDQGDYGPSEAFFEAVDKESIPSIREGLISHIAPR